MVCRSLPLNEREVSVSSRPSNVPAGSAVRPLPFEMQGGDPAEIREISPLERRDARVAQIQHIGQRRQMHLRHHRRAVRDPAVAGLRLDQLQQLVAQLGRALADAAGQVEAVRQGPVHLVAGLRRQRGMGQDRLARRWHRRSRRPRAATGCPLRSRCRRRQYRPPPPCTRTPAGCCPCPGHSWRGVRLLPPPV